MNPRKDNFRYYRKNKAAFQLAEGCISNLFSSKSLTASNMRSEALQYKQKLTEPAFSVAESASSSECVNFTTNRHVTIL